MATEELQDAVIRNIEVIGEAAKRVSPEMRGRLAELDWKRSCGMRDVLIHDYIGVDLEQVWNVASTRIPELQARWNGSFVGCSNKVSRKGYSIGLANFASSIATPCRISSMTIVIEAPAARCFMRNGSLIPSTSR